MRIDGWRVAFMSTSALVAPASPAIAVASARTDWHQHASPLRSPLGTASRAQRIALRGRPLASSTHALLRAPVQITRKLGRCGQEGCERAERNLARGNGRDHRRGPESAGAGVYCRLGREPCLADTRWAHEHDPSRTVRLERRGDELQLVLPTNQGPGDSHRGQRRSDRSFVASNSCSVAWAVPSADPASMRTLSGSSAGSATRCKSR